jgi:hypothetical protein
MVDPGSGGPIEIPMLRLTVCHEQQPTIIGTTGHDTLVATPGIDVIATLGGDDDIEDLSSSDIVCTAAPTLPYEVDSVGYCVDGPVNIRRGPSIDYDIVGRFGAYEQTAITGLAVSDAQDRTWYQVEHEGAAGWVAGWYLDEGDCDIDVLAWEIRNDGFGPLRFGDPVDDAMRILDMALGMPEWEGTFAPEACGPNFSARWETAGLSVQAQFVDSVLDGYDVARPWSDGPSPVTSAGIGAGSTVDQLLAAYPDAQLIESSEIGWRYKLGESNEFGTRPIEFYIDTWSPFDDPAAVRIQWINVGTCNTP